MASALEDALLRSSSSNCVFDDSARSPSAEKWGQEEEEEDSEIINLSHQPRDPKSSTLSSLASGRSETSSTWSTGFLNTFSSAQLGMTSVKSTLIRRRSSQLSSLLGTQERGCFYRLRQCFAWKWFWPLFVATVSLVAILLGVSCLVQSLDWFQSCPAVLIPSGIAFPVVCLILAIWYYVPTRYQVQQGDFYSEALLEEMLSGESILDVYTVTTRGEFSRDTSNVVVFLSGVGGVPETWLTQVEAVVDAGFTAISIQLPGSGALGGVRFSLPRAELVVNRVLENEVFALQAEQDVAPTNPYSTAIHDDNRMRSSSYASSSSSLASGPRLASHNQQDVNAGGRKVVLVAYGLACHVAMYLASSKRLGNERLAGIVLFGSPRLPTETHSYLSRMFYSAYRVSWIAESARWMEYAGLSKEATRLIELQALCPKARADWGKSFNAWSDSLITACSDFTGPVMCLSKDRGYLERMQSLWGKASGHDIGPDGVKSVDCIYARGLRDAGFRSYPDRRSDEIFSKYLVQFISAAFI